MTRQEIVMMLREVAPVHYQKAPIDTKVPFINYNIDYPDNFGADDKVYVPVMNITAMMYLTKKDLSLEDTMHRVLDEHNVYWTSSTDYDEKEKLYTIIYEMEVI